LLPPLVLQSAHVQRLASSLAAISAAPEKITATRNQ